MKIKTAIYDPNIEFMNRLAKIFQQKYPDKIELSIFTNEDALYQNLKVRQTDIVLMDQSVKIKAEMIPAGVVAGYLSSMPDVDKVEGFPAVYKYQKAEALYKMALSLCAEGMSGIKWKKSESDMKVILFTSVQGGSGTSTAAAAYALRKAAGKRKIFYLNLEKFGDSGLYFQGDGNLSFSDIIYTLKSKKGNLLMKLESVIQSDSSGVDFFRTSRNAYDMFELSEEEILAVMQAISQTGKYEELVVDLSGELTEFMITLMSDHADKILYVADGSDTGNGKFERFCEVSRVLEQRQECSILNKTRLFYNRYSSRQSFPIERASVPVVGGAHRFEENSGKELVRKISQLDAFDLL